MSSSWKHRLFPRVLAFTLLLGCLAHVTSISHVSAQRISPLEGDPNDYYCPAYFHSCASGDGMQSYFAPDPFDMGAACDDQFINYVPVGSTYDRDMNGVDDRSCYGQCDLTLNRNGTVDIECYANCQSNTSGFNYAGCLRNAFGINERPTPIGGGGGDPRIVGNVAGNIYRSCLAGQVPGLYADEYNSCIAAGGTVENCCSQVASHFP